MKRHNLWIWLGVSLGIHGGAVGVLTIMPGVYRDSQVLFERGTSSIEFVLVSSVESVAMTPHHIPEYKETEKDTEHFIEETAHKVDPFTEEGKESNYNPEPTENGFLPVVTTKVTPFQDHFGPSAINEVYENKYAQQTTEFTKQMDTVLTTQKVGDIPAEQIRDDLSVPEQSSQDSEGMIGDTLTKGSVSAKVEGQGKPNYPRECLINGHEGKVIVEITILANGENGGMTIIESSGCKRMDQSVLDFLGRCTLVPKMLFGKPIDSKKKIAFRFRILETDLLKSLETIK